MWDLPGPGLEPVSPALAGGLLTTEPPGKPHEQLSKVPTPLLSADAMVCGGPTSLFWVHCTCSSRGNHARLQPWTLPEELMLCYYANPCTTTAPPPSVSTDLQGQHWPDRLRLHPYQQQPPLLPGDVVTSGAAGNLCSQEVWGLSTCRVSTHVTDSSVS